MQRPYQKLKVYNTLSGNKEEFEPISAPHVGMYVCGPTVYSDVHLGNCRTFSSFDIIFRYLQHLDYKVRYVRNITDVGHLVGDADEGEDKIAKKARLEQLEPMEVVQRYSNGFHQVMHRLNNLPPSIEPTATGHIIEQIEMIQELLQKGLAYESQGSVYFDVNAYNEKYKGNYGKLSGRVLEDLLAGQRDLDGQHEKRNQVDFALWKNASPEHIMRWKSPWGIGFPGWHLECSVMSGKYLGASFDIHGGGMDLKFPHHECEIAQSHACNDVAPVKYWMHTNMLTLNGQRMGKSVGNAILPDELFDGSHELLDRPYSPMTLRFAMLQTHYRSTMDLSNDALTAASKGYKKMMNGLKTIKELEYIADEIVELNTKLDKQLVQLVDAVYRGMNDDFNTAVSIAGLFNMLKKVNNFHLGNEAIASVSEENFNLFKNTYINFIGDILGLIEEQPQIFNKTLTLVIDQYKEAKDTKNYDRVDVIRQELKEVGIVLKDMKTGIDWAYDEV